MDKQKKEPNYRGLFVIGLALIGAGISLSVTDIFAAGISIFSVSIVFLIIGVSNRKKWVNTYSYKDNKSEDNQDELPE